MRLRGGRDLEHPPVAWLPTGVLGVQSVRLRLRLDRRDDQGRGCWHLVDLDSEAESEPIGRRLRDRTPLTCSNSLMSIQTEASEMQSPLIAPPFVGGPSGKVPGRKRGRPPIRKLEFQSHYPEPLSSPKVPKKRGRKPGFKLKSRMVMTSMANSPTSSTPEPDMSSIPQDAATVPRSTTPQVHTAETSMPEDFLCDPVDSKRYAVDPSDSAFSVMATPFPPKHTYGYRGSSGGSAPLGMCRQASSPAYSPSQEAGEGKRPPGKDPSSWGVDQVVWFIKEADPQALGPHAEAFRKHEIDGHALLLLKSDMMMKYLGLKLGPALKLSYHIDRLRQNRF